MKILAVDTAANICAAAVYDTDGQHVLAAVSENIGKGHAEVLMGYIERALHQANMGFADIGRIAVNVGPGSFTGVRIGVSAARGFALALNCPAIGVTAFEALALEARDVHPDKPVLVAIDAHRGEIYAQLFRPDGEAEGEPLAASLEDMLALLARAPQKPVLTGSAAPIINEALGESALSVVSEAATGSIETIARIAASRKPGEAPKPLYLRGPDAKPQTGFALLRKTAS
ncbi:tRNA (adenosine(37)-N6)-threonylcarbamoyltransferase complex dimerization subunit type 1 TsaB [Phyllobacterium phragmitis]|uniref:tRNA (Adenosine(37)-N6)-threonylcarbamoyltransferase complex dimerization subunit type 1 TsaB n=1 Tax=Phyllobacterium phragmitis TaxID=2670329 RepID=A0A2S9IUQ1_9HYPH|nr:tRNA (adenosine(37)-N6)-threonylcarbamoyltransferase complex dimerization subunit type 1 TsaB [Phyllobacterium phragmitis]PRD44231.1 tRNA (adenosine(37)-N6)-threonylcarbamoyltransferase complex dimerization subunit type 1 TsaB [Phyllobacterium phragmitis]